MNSPRAFSLHLSARRTGCVVTCWARTLLTDSERKRRSQPSLPPRSASIRTA